MFINPTNIGARIHSQGTISSAGHKSFAVDEDHFVVGRITFSDTVDDEVRFWLDPDLDQVPLDSAPTSGATSLAVNPATWTYVYMRQIGDTPVDMIDEIRIGTDFFSVVPVAAVLPGDFNLDGSVDAADYVVWRKNDGTPAGYDTWRANFGATVGSGSGSADDSLTTNGAPEPASAALLLAGLLALVARRRVTRPGR